MKKYAVFSLLLLALMVFSAPIAAQTPVDDAPWEMIIFLESYDAAGEIIGAIARITPEGMGDPIPLPREIFGDPRMTVSQVSVSSDMRFVALTGWTEDYTVQPVRIADLAAGTCCVEFAPDGMVDFQLSNFDPSNQLITISYVYGVDTHNGGVRVMNAATGENVADVPMSLLTDIEYAPWALLGAWREDGLRYTPSCYACEPPFLGEWSVWEPISGTLTAASGEYFSAFADTLPLTQESLVLGVDLAYPRNPMDGMFPIPNVVQYVRDEPFVYPGDMTTAPTVYFNLDGYDLNGSEVHWVNNGNAFIVSSADETEWIVTSRNNSRSTVSVPPYSRILGGTPDGWINVATDGENSTFTYYQATGTGFNAFPIGSAVGYARAIVSPELGEGVGAPNFPPVMPPSAEEVAAARAANAITCEGFMPSRLMLGEYARVTPGVSNNVRESPTRASARVGEIPGGATFLIYDGPICSDGTAWWFVSYEDVIGYTVEGLGTEYFLEPNSP